MYRYAYFAVGALAAGVFCSTATAAVLVQDDFNQAARQGQLLAGTTTSDGKYTWSVRYGNDTAPVVDNDQMNFNGDQAIVYIQADSENNTELLQPNFVLSFDYIYGQGFSDNKELGINYRMATSQQAVSDSGPQPGYSLKIKKNASDSFKVSIVKENVTIVDWTEETFSGFGWNTPLSIRIEADGITQKIFFNNESSARIDVDDTSSTTTGGWNFQNPDGRNRSIDNVQFVSLPEPSALLSALSGFAMVFYSRRGLRRMR